MPTILGANSVSGYDIDNSLRFELSGNADLVQTFASAGNRRTWTWSGWIKKSTVDLRQTIFHQYNATNNNEWMEMRFEADNKITVSHYSQGIFTTAEKFRDPSAWYHLVLAVDTTQGTDTDRVKLYVNGSQATGVNVGAYPSENFLTGMNQDSAHAIGHYENNGNFNADYQICEVHSTDGTANLPTAFGKFNGNGVWVPIKYTGSYGTNGYFLEFQQTGTSANSSGIGADTSGNDHHFTPTNLAATDITTDTCTNNFATLNPLAVSRFSSGNAATFAEGNCQISTEASNNDRVVSVASMGVTSGKWYWEVKAVVAAQCETGVCEANTVLGYSQHFNNETDPRAISVNPGGNIYGKGGEDYDDHENWAADLSNNDIIMWALDMDNYELWHGINGTWTDSGDPTSGATGTGGIVNESSNAYRSNLNHGEPMFPFIQDGGTGGQMKAYFNFGNPVVANSSSQTDDNGHGDFEYDVPTGFYALNTKNLAEFG